MKKSPKLSIVIPVYNVEKYLSKCLTSVIEQTLHDIEIICVNDGTKDNSCEIIKQFQRYDKRISLIDKENGGLSSARNAGIKAAQGEYICFLDSDDYLENNACERLYIEVLEGHADIIVYGAKIFPVVPAPNYWLRMVLSPRTVSYSKFNPDILFQENGAHPFVWRQCFKRSFLIQNDLFFNEDVKFGEDLVFQFCVFPQADKITFISDKLYSYRWYREESLMFSASKNLYVKYDQHIKLVDIIAEYWQSKGYIELYKKDLFDWSVGFIGYDLKHYADTELKTKLIKNIFLIWNKYGLDEDDSKIKNKCLLRYLKHKYKTGK